MAYGLSFFKGLTTGFDDWIATRNTDSPALKAQYLAEQVEDNTGITSTRVQVIDAFLANSITPIVPTNAEIRGWMISGLSTFNSYYNNLYYSGPASWQVKIIADRVFQNSIISPLTVRQEANQNGSPSESTQSTTGFNKTAFLLGIDNGTITEDVTGNTAVLCVNPFERTETFYENFPRPNYLGTVGYNGTNSLTQVWGGDFIIPQNTNWCAEAWIYPTRFGGGILGSGDYGPGSWQLFHNQSNGVIQLISEVIAPVNRTFTTWWWSSSILSIYGTFPPPGLVVGTQIIPPAAYGALVPMYVTGIDYESNYITVNPVFIGGSLDEDGNPTNYKRTFISELDSNGEPLPTVFPDEFKFTYVTNEVTTSYMDSGARTAPTYTWTHVAASLTGTTLRIFVNGIVSATKTIAPTVFRPNKIDQSYYIGVHEKSSASPMYFQGYISSPRLVNGKAIYTSNFSPSTKAPGTTKINVIKAFANNLAGPVVPSERDIQYWMFKGFDYGTLQFSSTDVTWNQVDAFYKLANTNVSNTYASCVGREMLVTQILVGTPDFTRTFYANTIYTNASGSIYITGANVDTYIMVLMR